ncbi:MAG: hypothetical protein R3E66_20835 [bacterium]
MTIECPHRPACDGCPRFEQTQAQRANELLESLVRLAQQFDLRTPSDLGMADHDLGYRNRARMVVRPQEAKPLGYFGAGSRDYVGVDACLVHDPRIESVLDTVRAFSTHTVVKAARFIDVRAGKNTIITFAVSQALDEGATADFVQRLHARHPDLGVQINVGAKHGVLSGTQVLVCGPEAVTFELAGKSFEAPPTAFFQVNTEMLGAMHERMASWIGDEPIIDCYSGVGVHGLALGTGPVYGMDNVAVSVDYADRNAKANGREAQFECVDDADSSAWQPPFAGATIIVNPARAGLQKAFLERIGTQQAKQILYVSCSPISFYRDAERLARLGWACEDLHAFELMPRTNHVELVARFVPGPARQAPKRAADEDSTWVAIVDGVVPHGALPNGPGGDIMARRIRTLGGVSVIRLVCKEPIDADTVCQRLRAWKHPVVGDDAYGSRKLNATWLRDRYVDEAMVACIRDGEFVYAVPGLLAATAQLPATAFERS